MDEKEIPKPRSKNAKKDVDDFLNSLGVDSKSYSSPSEKTPLSTDSPKESEKNSDVFSFLDQLSDSQEKKASSKKVVENIPQPDISKDTLPNESVPLKESKIETLVEAPQSKVETKVDPIAENKEDTTDANSWSFGGLWSTASSAIKKTQNSEYFKLNVESVKTALTEISETVRSNENAQYLGSTVKDLVNNEKLVKIGSDIKSLTQQGVNSVINSFQEYDEDHHTLNIYIYSDQEYKKIENLAYQLLDPLLEEELLFQDIHFLDADSIIDKEDNFWKENIKAEKISQGFKEAFDLSKLIAHKVSENFKNLIQEANNSVPNTTDALISKLEDNLLAPTAKTDVFLSIIPCRAAPLPDAARIFFSLVLISPQYPEAVFRTFSQPLPTCTTLYKSKLDDIGKSNEEKSQFIPDTEEHSHIALKAIQMAIQFLLIDFFDTVTKNRKTSAPKPTESTSKN